MSNSRSVSSNQPGIHRNLESVVRRHLQHEFRKPIAKHSLLAYKNLLSQLTGERIILDSGCGNGKSTRAIALAHPDTFVIGIDKSQHRLEKSNTHSHAGNPSNYRLVRADVIDFWRLALADSIKPCRHYLLYPNPWPKSRHLQRRWHGSPVFPELLKLGGTLELRTNWETYAREFGTALGIAGIESACHEFQPTPAGYLTDFEAKYHQSGHQLWQVIAHLPVNSQY